MEKARSSQQNDRGIHPLWLLGNLLSSRRRRCGDKTKILRQREAQLASCDLCRQTSHQYCSVPPAPRNESPQSQKQNTGTTQISPFDRLTLQNLWQATKKGEHEQVDGNESYDTIDYFCFINKIHPLNKNIPTVLFIFSWYFMCIMSQVAVLADSLEQEEVNGMNWLSCYGHINIEETSLTLIRNCQ